MTESLYHRLIGNETDIDGAVPRELPYTAVLQGRSLWVEAAAALPQQEAVIDTVLPANGNCLLLQKTLQLLRLEHGIHHRLLFRDVSGRIAVIENAVVVINADALHLFHLRSFQFHLTHGTFLLPRRSQLHELLPRPVRQVFFVQHTDELVSIPACHLPIAKTGAANRTPNGGGAASEAVMGVPNMDWEK